MVGGGQVRQFPQQPAFLGVPVKQRNYYTSGYRSYVPASKRLNFQHFVKMTINPAQLKLNLINSLHWWLYHLDACNCLHLSRLDVLQLTLLQNNNKKRSHTFTLLTRRLGAGTARLWRCGPEAAAPGRRSAGWRAPWRGSSDNPGTLWSPCRSVDTRPTAGEELCPGPETTPGRKQEVSP